MFLGQEETIHEKRVKQASELAKKEGEASGIPLALICLEPILFFKLLMD